MTEQLKRAAADVLRQLDRIEQGAALEKALELSDAALERSLGVAPGSIRELAEAEARALEAPATDPAGPPVSPAVAAGITQPIRTPSPDAPRRPIDDAQWEGDQFRPRVPITVESAIRYETDPCPRWMTPNTYRWLLARLAQGMKEAPAMPLDHLHAWAARHIWIVFAPPKLVSSASASDLIGPALEFIRQARRHGFTNEELARGGRRRLLR